MRGRVALVLLAVALAGGEPVARAAPIKTQMAAQKLTLSVRKLKGIGGDILKEPLKAGIGSSALHWDYIPGTSISVPYITVQLARIPTDPRLTVLIARTGKLVPDPKLGYVVSVPLLHKENPILVTVIDPVGAYEDWEITVGVGLIESALFVDESCTDYFLKIREVRRPAGPNLIFLGCKAGAGPKDLFLEMLWGDVERVEYGGARIMAESSILSIPLDPKRAGESQLIGVHPLGAQSLYSIQYQPYLPPPYELWAGLAFFHTSFSQSNFGSQFSQVSSAFLGKFWYRPEDIPLSFMVRGFGSLLSFSDTLDPPTGEDESVQTYFLDGELRYRVLDRKGWKIDPLAGAWVFFMRVKSRGFGLQRIINPVIGAVVNRQIGLRDSLELTFRLAPLQQFFNPFDFSTNQLYFETELTYVRPFRKRNRFFATLSYGTLRYAPEGFAATSGNYLTLGGGYGW